MVTEYAYPVLGGVPEHVHNLSLQLVRMGHEVTVVTANAPFRLRRRARAVDAELPERAVVAVERLEHRRPPGPVQNPRRRAGELPGDRSVLIAQDPAIAEEAPGQGDRIRLGQSGEKVGKPDIEEKDMTYLYAQGDEFHFMEQRTFEQTYLDAKTLGEAKNFLKENINASILFYNGKAIGVSLPNSVDLKVIKCDPGVRGDTVSGAMKAATMETGYTVNVPLFINEGDVLKIDTRDGKYLTRVATV